MNFQIAMSLFSHSFGYDCKKRSNLNILDPDILIFSAGNVAKLLNMKSKEQTYIRTTSGGGVGAIAVIILT